MLNKLRTIWGIIRSNQSLLVTDKEIVYNILNDQSMSDLGNIFRWTDPQGWEIFKLGELHEISARMN